MIEMVTPINKATLFWMCNYDIGVSKLHYECATLQSKKFVNWNDCSEWKIILCMEDLAADFSKEKTFVGFVTSSVHVWGSL